MDHRDNLRDKQCQKSLVSESAVTCSTTGNQLSPTPASASRHPRMVTLSFPENNSGTHPSTGSSQLSHTPCPSPALPLSQVFMQTLCPAHLCSHQPQSQILSPLSWASSSPVPPSLTPPRAPGHPQARSFRAEHKHSHPERASVWRTSTNPLCCLAPLSVHPSHLSTGLRPCGPTAEVLWNLLGLRFPE